MRITLILPVVLLLAGCSLLRPMPEARQPSPVQISLSRTLYSYHMPAQSIPPAANRDPQVDAAIHSMQRIATAQGMIFDGSRAGEGTVFVGREGSAGQMVLAIAVFPEAGRVAMQDVYQWRASDMSAGFHMRKKFLETLSQPPGR